MQAVRRKFTPNQLVQKIHNIDGMTLKYFFRYQYFQTHYFFLIFFLISCFFFAINISIFLLTVMQICTFILTAEFHFLLSLRIAFDYNEVYSQFIYGSILTEIMVRFKLFST